MLVSERFAGDPVLQDCLAGTHRMLPPERGPAVGKIQQALIELGFDLPVGHVDSQFGRETADAVSQFKASRGIQPSDGVVGPKTMAALDAEFAELVIPPPPPEPVIGSDPFGRRPAAEACVPAAHATVAAFRARPSGSNWLHLDRREVADGIASNALSPDRVSQGGNGLCTSAAFVNLWVQDAPDAYAAFATALFDNGAADLAPKQGAGGALRITASPALLGADYPRIVERMQKRGFSVPSQTDWMVLSALRDSSNVVVDFTGDPGDWVSHNLGDGAIVGHSDMVGWLRASGMFSSITNEANDLVTKSPSHAVGLDPARSRCILAIDARMIIATRARHDLVLRSRVVENDDGTFDLRVWTWGGVRSVRASAGQFADNYYGAIIGFP
jgi:peptidoglycan hydrolase-like protein with peptidoglycan-binding domain